MTTLEKHSAGFGQRRIDDGVVSMLLDSGARRRGIGEAGLLAGR